jgi:hypothetical protein
MEKLHEDCAEFCKEAEQAAYWRVANVCFGKYKKKQPKKTGVRSARAEYRGQNHQSTNTQQTTFLSLSLALFTIRV